MSDDYQVSGGGSTAVASNELIDEAWRLGVAEQHCGLLAERVSVVLAMLDRTGTALGRSDDELVFARYQLGEVANVASQLGGRLTEAAENYGLAEQRLTALRSVAAQGQAWLTGVAVRFAAPGAILLVPAAIEAAMLSQAAQKLLGIEPAGLDEETKRGLLSWPGIGQALGLGADSLDEAIAGLAGAPAGLALSVGSQQQAAENGAVLLGIAAALSAATGSRVLAEREVVVRQQGAGAPGAPGRAGLSAGVAVDPPQRLGEFTERIPDGADGEPQVRVERYDGEPGERPRWVVYVTGTIDFSPVAGDQPVDFTHDVSGVADRSAIADLLGLPSGAAERAVRQALVEAGMQPGDELAAFGYSAGGEVVANLATDPALNVVAAVNLGGPGEVEAPQLLNVRHLDDPVPGSGGAFRAEAPLVFSRTVEPPLGRPDDLLAPAHHIDAYQHSVELADASRDDRLVDFRDQLAEFVEGREGTATMWLAERLPPERPAAAAPAVAYEPPLPADPRTTPNPVSG